MIWSNRSGSMYGGRGAAATTNVTLLLTCVVAVVLGTNLFCQQPVASPQAPAPPDKPDGTPAKPGQAPPPAANDPAQAPSVAGPAPGTQTERVLVEHVIDGDTCVLEGGDRVRYIGINTAERGMPFYETAKQLNAHFIAGREIVLEIDAKATDSYGRRLAYVWVDGILLNELLVRLGLAYCYVWKPNVRHRLRLLLAQQEARSAKLGLWGAPPELVAPFYVAARHAHTFHRPECPKAVLIPERRLVFFVSRNAAIDKGFNPHRRCAP